MASFPEHGGIQVQVDFLQLFGVLELAQVVGRLLGFLGVSIVLLVRVQLH